MALKRVHVAFNDQQLSILRRLSAKWGLDLTNTVRHCIMRIAEQEGLTPGHPEKPPSSR